MALASRVPVNRRNNAKLPVVNRGKFHVTGFLRFGVEGTSRPSQPNVEQSIHGPICHLDLDGNS